MATALLLRAAPKVFGGKELQRTCSLLPALLKTEQPKLWHQGQQRQASSSNSSSSSGSKVRYIISPLPTPFNFGIIVVPEKQAYVIERSGSFLKTMHSGRHLLNPFVDRVAYVHCLRQQAIPISQPLPMTKDNVGLVLEGMLYVKVVDAAKASYEVDNALRAAGHLARSSMHLELSRALLDDSVKLSDMDWEPIAANVQRRVSGAVEPWGLECLRYEVCGLSSSRCKEPEELRVEGEHRMGLELAGLKKKQQDEGLQGFVRACGLIIFVGMCCWPGDTLTSPMKLLIIILMIIIYA